MKPTTTLTVLISSLLLPELCWSQRRSKVSATQSVSQVDFDCPEEFGYYPHPGDCTQYYVCVFGGALLESCTGGLMYSHELQTCDWPRNVGCGGDGEGATVSTVRVTDPRTRQPPPPQTFNRATSSQRQPIQREELSVQKQHQLYAEEDLGPAEEIESDRQQRVYRGQPSTLGQVARDRDGLSRHSNALQVPQVSPGTGREKLSVVSFGTQQQYTSDLQTLMKNSYLKHDNPNHDLQTNQLHRQKRQTRIRQQVVQYQLPLQTTVETVTDAYTSHTQAKPAVLLVTAPVTDKTLNDALRQSASPASYQESQVTSKGSGRTYNNTQYNPSHYDSFYNLYDEEPEIYKDIEYSQYNAQNTNNQQQSQQQQPQQQYRAQSYKEKQQQPVAIAQKVQVEQQQATQQQRYSQQPNYNAQDIYAQSISQDYNDNYNLQNDDIQYNKQPSAIQGKSSASRLQQVASTTASQPVSESESTNEPAPVGLKVIDATPSPSTVAPSTSKTPENFIPNRRLQLSAAFSPDTSDSPPVTPSRRIVTPSNRRGSFKSYTVEDPKTINDAFISAFIKDYIDDESSFGLTLKQIAADNAEKKKEELSSAQYSSARAVDEGSTSTESDFQSRVISNDRLNPPSVIPSRVVEKTFVASEQPSRMQKQKNYFELASNFEKPSTTETSSRSHNSFRIVVDPTPTVPEVEDMSLNDKSILRQIKVTNIRSRVMTHQNPSEDLSSDERVRNENPSQTFSSESGSDEGLSSTSRSRYRIRPRPEEDSSVRSTYSIPVTSTTTPRSIRPVAAGNNNRYRNEYDEEKGVNIIRQTTTTTQESIPRIRVKSDYTREFDNSEPTFKYIKEETTPTNLRKPINTVEYNAVSSEANIKQFDEINENSNEEVIDEKPRTQYPSRSRTSSRFNPSSRFQVSAPESTNDIVDTPRNPEPVGRGRGSSNPSRCPQGLENQSECNEKPPVRVRPAVPSTETPSTTPTISSPGLSRGAGRTRGSATYTISPNEAEPVNRGTPAPAGRAARPTLKPSTAIVSKASEYIDIFRYPPRRPDPIYPAPQVDKTAAKCRKDVCLLPDCYCGGKETPADLTPEETPQIVLLTFDDSINDLNKGLYSDLFEKGRTNPNGCPISATFYVSHEWTDYSQVQNLYAAGHEMASHSVSHSFGEQFSQKKWLREIGGQREILAAYGGVRLEDIRGMRAPFLAVGGNKMFKMLYDGNFTYDSSMPVYENKPPSWPYTLDYKLFHDCMIPPCPTRSYPGVWEVPMVMWQDLNGGRCSMGDACSNPPTADGVYKMLIKNFERHFTSNRAPFGLFYHAAWFTQPHHKEGFIAFLDTIVNMPEVWLVSNWQAIQWVRDPTPISRLNNFAPFQCNYPERPRRCNNPKVCNLWHKSGVRYMRTCQPCPEIYPWTGKTGIRNSRVDNEIVQE